MTHPNRAELRNSVLTALERLRAVFPLEQRLTAVDAEARRGYAAILRTWLGGGVPQAQDVPAAVLATLQQIDAVVATDTGLGCYPFSARTTGISVALPHATVAAMCAIADEALQDALAAHPDEIVAVGGTATNLLKVTAAGTLDRVLTRDRVTEAMEALASAPAADITARYLVNPTRARLLPAGAVLVDAILRRYGVDRLTVSDAGLREGAIFAAAHAGHAWRDRLPELAHGWRA